MNQAIARKSDVQQDSQWRTCHACDAVYTGTTCGKCTADAGRWSRALERAIANALDVYICGATGEAFVESASTPGTLYSVSREHCTCPAGLQGKICQHRAAYLAQCGELSLDPEPERIQFVCENSDRYEIVVDGEFFGHVVANQWGGWEVFRGAFPTATRFWSADGCTLDEVERQLRYQLPVELLAQPGHRRQPRRHHPRCRLVPLGRRR